MNVWLSSGNTSRTFRYAATSEFSRSLLLLSFVAAARSKAVRLRNALPALAAVAMVLGAAGCGSASQGGSNSTPAQTRAKQLVTERDIASVPSDSPAATVMRWWRFLQFRDPKDALELMDPALRPHLLSHGWNTSVVFDFGPWLTTIRPRVISVTRNDRRATVFLDVEINVPVGADIVKTSHDQLALPLSQDKSGNWLITDASFFERQSAVLSGGRLRAQAAAQKQQPAQP